LLTRIMLHLVHSQPNACEKICVRKDGFQIFQIIQCWQRRSNIDAKFYGSGWLNGDLPLVLFQSVSKRFMRNYIGRKTERN